MRSSTPLVALIGAAALALTACTVPGASGKDGGSKEFAVDGTFPMSMGSDP